MMNKFKNNSLYSNQNGYASIIIIIVVLVAVFWFLFFPKVTPFPEDEGTVIGGNSFCALENSANPPTIQAFEYELRQDGCGPDDPGGNCTTLRINDGVSSRPAKPAVYKRIKSNVLIWERFFTGSGCGNPKSQRDVCMNGEDVHFYQSRVQPNGTSSDGNSYEIWYPSPENGESYKFGPEQRSLIFLPYGLLFLVHPNEKAIDLDELQSNDGNAERFVRMWKVDIYQQEGKPQLPDYITNCTVVGTNATVNPEQTPQVTVTEPEQNKSVDKNQLQLEYFLFNKDTPVAISSGWWTPECKPAIYLYPEEETQVHVKVHPKGFLTYTDPLYPQDGWVTTAFPDGRLLYEGKEYPYLYYESKILDRYVTKPTEGYVVSYGQLSTLYESLLPQLGLNEQETKDFKDYWQKYLPYAPYYFVGVMSEESIEEIEPLTITPSPATVIRVRTYFEALNQVKSVKAPILEKKIRDGFTVVEWGGMVKVDKNHPFTCSQ